MLFRWLHWTKNFSIVDIINEIRSSFKKSGTMFFKMTISVCYAHSFLLSSNFYFIQYNLHITNYDIVPSLTIDFI
jgi:hypothetical protein